MNRVYHCGKNPNQVCLPASQGALCNPEEDICKNCYLNSEDNSLENVDENHELILKLCSLNTYEEVKELLSKHDSEVEEKFLNYVRDAIETVESRGRGINQLKCDLGIE